MKIRLCKEEDINALVNIANRSYLDHYTYLWNDAGMEYLESNFSYDVLKKELEDNNANFYLIHYQNKIAGYFKININKGIDNYSSAEALELERIYFIKEGTGKGLGTLVIDFVIDLAKEKLKKLVWLKAMESSAAVAFYEKHKFLITDAYNLAFPTMKEEYRKILVMCRAI